MIRTIHWWEPIAFFTAILVFTFFRLPFVAYWWTDFQSDFALVGIMAQHTKLGQFPIYYYGQNYMGGAEWLTAALLSKFVDGNNYVSLTVLRINSLAWWFSVGIIWFLALRREKIILAHVFLAIFALGSSHLFRISVLQELSPQPLVMGGILFSLFRSGALSKWNWGAIGFVSGIAWWINQGVVFFLVPMFFCFYFFPQKAWRSEPWKFFLGFEPRLKRLYSIGFILAIMGGFIALFGGLHLEQPIRLKVPNGMSLARDVFLVVVILHLAFKLYRNRKERVFTPIQIQGCIAFLFAFLVGFSPSWLGRILGLYEKGYGVGLGIIPISRWGQQLSGLSNSIFELIFSSSSLALAGGLISFSILFFVLRRSQFWKIDVFQFFVFVFFFNILYVFISDRSEGAPVRYLYPAYMAAILCLSFLLTELPRSWIRWFFTGILLVAMGSFSWKSRQENLARGNQMIKRKIQLDSVSQLLTAGNFQYCWGDYWSTYLISFLTEEKIIIAPHPDSPAPQVRIQKDYLSVAKANPNCYLYREEDGVLATIYFSDKNPWVKNDR